LTDWTDLTDLSGLSDWKNPLTRYDRAPVGDLVGMQIEPHRVEGQAIVRLEVTDRHHNPMGTLHGGILALLADTAMGVAFGRTLEATQSFGTIDLRVDFIRPVTMATLTATGQIVKRGSRVGFLRAEVHNQTGKLVATANCTCLVISPE
jgi:uncharacterized protein (TIGR00369 family)